jgi:hypothetical protein
MEINKEELQNFIRQYNFTLSIHIKMLQGKWAHVVQNTPLVNGKIVDNTDNNLYLRVFFDKTAVDMLNKDWNDYLLSDYIQFQREVKINKILN